MCLCRFYLRVCVQHAKVTEDFNLLASSDQALQGDVHRAKDSSDRGILDQLRYRFFIFVFRLGEIRFNWRL